MLLAALLAGCGSSGPAPALAAPTAGGAQPSPVPVSTHGGEDHVIVHVGDRFRLVLPAGAAVSENGLREVADEGGGVFHAIGVGTASIEVTRRPGCSPGAACSQLVQLLSVVEVTVKA